jgi:hypothetical protein
MKLLQQFWFFFMLVLSLGGALQGCAENLENIRPISPGAPTIQLKCGVMPDSSVTRDQAFCIAKLTGLRPGTRRWAFREYPGYVDVYNTISSGPPERGLSIRIATPGGQVISFEPWEEIQLDAAVRPTRRLKRTAKAAAQPQ